MVKTGENTDEHMHTNFSEMTLVYHWLPNFAFVSPIYGCSFEIMLCDVIIA